VVERVQDTQRGDAIRVLDREIDGRRAARVMTYRNYSTKIERLDDRLKVTDLLAETIGRTGGFVGSTESHKVECDDPSSCADQVWN
jgi:hypothetical protein